MQRPAFTFGLFLLPIFCNGLHIFQTTPGEFKNRKRQPESADVFCYYNILKGDGNILFYKLS